jgi:hypothetical protein
MNQLIHIQKLLDKYWDAETSLAEEKELQQYFQADNIPAEFSAYKSLFIAKSTVLNATISEGFEANFLAQLETKEKISSIQNTNVTTQSQSAEIKKLRWIAGIAASIALILAVYIVMPQDSFNGFAFNNASELTGSEHKQALEAYQQTKSALFYVSEKMNEGAMKAAEGLNKIPDLNKTIEEIE